MMKGTFDEKLFVKAMKALNKHLPAERKTLVELLNEAKPAILGRDQSIHRIKRDELEEIARLIPKEEHKNLKLPIYIELTPDYGRGIARIHGKQDCELVKRILEDVKERNREKGEDSIKGDELFIYREDVRTLRRKLPTTTEYAFFYSASL